MAAREVKAGTRRVLALVAVAALVVTLVTGSGGAVHAAAPPCGPTWTIVQSPNPGAEHNVLNDVSAVSARDAWAVGSVFDESREEVSTLILHWDGASWSVVPSPNVGTLGNHLEGVTAVSARDVWAVGFRFKLIEGIFVPVPLILHWDGSAWTVVPAPGRGRPRNGVVSGVVAVGPRDAWAAGSAAINPLFSVDFGRKTLIEHWDGRRWSVVPSENVPSALASSLGALAASGRRDVWAVGASMGEDTGQSTLVEHWDGSAWSIVESPNRVDPEVEVHDNSLRDVVALSNSNAWAVGEGEGKTLIIHWDGVGWSTVRSPAPGILSGLYAADGLGPRRVFAVGVFLEPETFVLRPLAMWWDGQRWRLIPSETIPDAFDTRLLGLAVTDRLHIAVGTSTSEDGRHTLIEHRCPPG
jgi:hypothetical protein